MAKKFNLADYVQPAASESDTMELREIPLAKLIGNGRNFYGLRDVEELADSIALNGQLEPLLVYPYGDAAGDYRLISGHRRLAALRMHKAETALCRVLPKPESTAREDLLIIQANAQRVKTPAELVAEADKMTEALVALKKQGAELPGRLRDRVADALGISPSALARRKVIQKQLKVPGFKAAYESGKMGETVAYELARLPENDQYRALDLLIDEGVSYDSTDIKAVNRIKRKLEAGESSKQDLHVEAEKRGIRIKDEDFSPLLAALVRETMPEQILTGLRRCRTKTEGLAYLHDFGMLHDGTAGFPVDHESDPQGLTITKPVRRRLKWPEVWELLALDAMQRKPQAETQAPHPPAAPAPSPEGEGGPTRASAPTRETTLLGWRRCADDPPETGTLVLVIDFFSDGDAAVDLCRFSGKEYCDPNNGEAGIYINKRRSWWIPSPDVTEEMRGCDDNGQGFG